MKMNEQQFALIKEQLRKLTSQECFYKHKLEGINVDDIKSQEDFEKLPFTWKGDLRDAYPLGLQAVPDEEIVRIHSSSGTTGTPVIIPYTKKDVEDWAIMFERCYRMAGITNLDRIQITPGYGLWTAGIGFQLGCERLGAMAIPMGPGNTDKQLKMMVDMQSTVLCATSSYALLLAEEIAKRGISDKIKLKKGIIGSERWGEKMRDRISKELGIELYDIYGLTEVYGPGIGVSCGEHNGIHVWDDYLYFEIVDPVTGENLPDGEVGELVITTLKSRALPLSASAHMTLQELSRENVPAAASAPELTPFSEEQTIWSRSRVSTSSPARSRNFSKTLMAHQASISSLSTTLRARTSAHFMLKQKRALTSTNWSTGSLRASRARSA